MKRILLIILILLSTYFLYTTKGSKKVEQYAYIVGETEASQMPSKTSNYVFDFGECTNGATLEWDYNSWEPVVLNLTSSRTKCSIHFTENKYKENILNGTDPVYNDNLIPVIVSSDGSVRVANISKEWYNYEDHKWANAIILKDNNKKVHTNEIISEEDIESYFVWIPRFAYKVKDMGNYTTVTSVTSKESSFDIEFENITSPKRTATNVGDYHSHPAFQSFNTNGFWVGKFETGNNADVTHNDIVPNEIQIKPNVQSWRNIQAANAFYSAYNYKHVNGAHNEELDPHMMKNTEWGAVAILTNTKYGRYNSDGTCIQGGCEVRMNNNSDYYTGYAAINAPTCGFTGDNQPCNVFSTSSTETTPWNTDVGTLASTTVNTTVIYDMSGGAWEYVMGILLDSTNTEPVSGRSNLFNSGFKGKFGCPACDNDTVTEKTTGLDWPDNKYYDTYYYANTNATFIQNTLGDMTIENGPFELKTYHKIDGEEVTRSVSSWYSDFSQYIYNGQPWFVRGGYIAKGTYNGIFAYSDVTGDKYSYMSFRIVLSPE